MIISDILQAVEEEISKIENARNETNYEVHSAQLFKKSSSLTEDVTIDNKKVPSTKKTRNICEEDSG